MSSLAFARGGRIGLSTTVSVVAMMLAGSPAFAQDAGSQQSATPATTQAQQSSGITAPSGDSGQATTNPTDPATSSAAVDPATDGNPAPTADVVVTGVRASLRSAQQIKRNSDQIVDSIVAEDIGKLPSP
jgi:iron complex outermembrane receptor protein